MNPFVEFGARPGGVFKVSDDESETTATSVTFNQAEGYANQAKNAYKKALKDHALLPSWLGLGLIPLTAWASGLAITGGSTDTITGIGLGAASAYAVSTWLNNPDRLKVYIAGIKAVNCTLTLMRPFEIKLDGINTDLENLNDLISMVEDASQTLDQKIKSYGKALDPVEKTLGLAELARAQAMSIKGRETYQAGGVLARQVQHAPRKLVTAIDDIGASVDLAISQTLPNLQTLPLIIQGLPNLSNQLAPLPETTDKDSDVDPKAKRLKEETINDELIELKKLVIKLSSAELKISSLVNGVKASLPTAELSSCGISVDMSIPEIILNPPGPINLEQGRSTEIAVSGGKFPHFVSGGDTASGVIPNMVGGGKSFKITTTDAAKPGKYSVLVQDSSNYQKFFEVNVTAKEAVKEAVLNFKMADSEFEEDKGVVKIKVTLSKVVDKTVTVEYQVTKGSENAGKDFNLEGGKLTFNPNELTKSILVEILKDEEKESPEIVEITLVNPSQAVLGSVNVHKLTIMDMGSKPSNMSLIMEDSCHEDSKLRGRAKMLLKTPSPKIVGGIEAKPKTWPWMVAIGSRIGGIFDVSCGGSLIEKNWVLTAAHCEINKTRQEVLIGAHNVTQNEPDAKTFKIKKVINHCNFDPQTYDFDIALLELESEADFEAIALIDSETEDSLAQPSAKATVIGWGDLAFEGDPPDKLQQVEVPIISNVDCSLRYDGGISSNMICAGIEGKDSCQGDSGGPFMVKSSDGSWLQTGIVSFGEKCADKKFPGVYTRVSQFIPWVEWKITGKKPVSTTGNGNTEPSVLIPGNLPKFVSPRMDLAQVREDAFILILNLRQLKKQSDMDRVIEESLSKIQNQEKKRRLSEDLKFMISRRKQIESNIISSLEKTEKLVGDRSIDSSIDGLEEDWKRLSQILIGKSKIPQSISDQLLSTQGEAKNIVYKLSKLSGSLRSLSSDADSYLEKTKIFNNNLNGSGKD